MKNENDERDPKQEKNVYTIREAKIIEVPRDQVKSWEHAFISKEATEKYMYKSGAAHNLPAKTQEKLHKQFAPDMSTAPKKVKERMTTSEKVKEFTQKKNNKNVGKSKDVEIER
jgi:imidazolonepropionase-like amidohydrolase